MIFNTKIVDFILTEFDNGINLFTETPFYKGDSMVRKSGLSFKLTEEEFNEYIKCSEDIMYFAERYCQIKREDGSIGHIKLRDYQKEYLDILNSKKYVVSAIARETGINIIHAIHILFLSIFNNEKTTLIVSNSLESSREVISLIQDIYCNLPFFMKPGVSAWNQKSILFENGCKIRTAARSKTPAIGFTIDYLYIFEFAHIPPNIIEPYYSALYPMMSSRQNSKIVISSTPNGENFFYELLKNAERDGSDPLKNSYTPYRVSYDQVPGRDENWVKNKIEEWLGNEEIFNQEYRLMFNPNVKEVKILTDNSSVHEYLELPTKEYLLSELKRLEDLINKLN